jgi:hypothetical protein
VSKDKKETKMSQEKKTQEYNTKAFLEFNEAEMKAFFDDVEAKKNVEENAKDTQETWQEKITEARQELTSLSIDELKKRKIKAQTNLEKATLQNRNSSLEFGVPVASLVFSVLAIIVSLRPEEHAKYVIFPFFLFFQTIASKKSSNGLFVLIAIILVLFTIAIVGVILRGWWHNRQRKHQVFYYKTMLNIIASIEEEWEHSNRYDVSVHNTETGETKQFNAHLLPKNK